MKVGVPQVGIVAPILFLIYINDLLNHVSEKVDVFMYADDANNLLSASDIPTETLMTPYHI